MPIACRPPVHDPEAHVDVGPLARSSQEAKMLVQRGFGTLAWYGSAFAALALLVTLGAACSDDDGQKPGADSGADTGAMDTGTDGEFSGDGQAADIMVVDSGTGACNASLDISPLVLASTYCVGAKVQAPQAGPFAFDAAHLWTLETGSAARSYSVQERALDLTNNSLGTASTVFGFTVGGTQSLFAGEYLAVWSATGSAAAGYTLKDQSGGLFSGTGPSTPQGISAKGNYDVVYLDADTLLINGLGAGAADDGQGLYVYKSGQGRRLISDLGSFSGFVAVGQDVVFAGGFNTQNEIRAFSKAELQVAISGNTTLAAGAAGDLVYAGDVTDVAVLHNDLVILDDDFVNFNAVRRIAITVNGDAVSKGATSDVVTPAGSGKVTALGAAGPWLGIRFTDGSSDDIALLRMK